MASCSETGNIQYGFVIWMFSVKENNMVEVITIGRNSDRKQRTSQKSQADCFDAVLREHWLIDGLGGELTIAEQYADIGKSGSKNFEKRTDVIKLLEDVRSVHRGKPLLVMNTSRFDRQECLDTLELFNILKKNGVPLVSIEDRKIYRGQEISELIDLLLKADQNHQWSVTIAKGVVRGRTNKAEQGQFTGSIVPYGMARLIIDDEGVQKTYPRTSKFCKPKNWQGYLVPGCETEQSIVKWLFEEYATKNISRCELAAILNRHDDPIVRSGPAGNGWYDNTVRNILQNEHYIGVEFVGRASSGAFYRVGATDPVKTSESTATIVRQGRNERGRLIDDVTWETVQTKLNRLKGRKPKTASNGEGFVLTGVLRCGNCGGHLYGRVSTSGVHYRCNNTHKNDAKGCGTWKVYESEMLPFLLAEIDAELLRKLEDRPMVNEHDDGRITQLESSLLETDKAIETLKAKIRKNPSSADVLADTIIELGQKRTELAEAIAAVQPDTGDTIMRAVDRWKELVQPYLHSVRIDNVGHDDPVVQKLGLQDDCDRLFNFADVRPSVLRETLHSLGCSVELWFAKSANGKHNWQVDTGRLTASIQGKDISGNIRTSVCRRSCPIG